MSTPQHPVGRRSAAVYRRRRLMVLLVLIAIVVLVVLAIARPWRGSAGPRAASSSVPVAASTTPSPARTATGTAAPTPGSLTPSAAATSTPAATPASAVTPCDPANVDVEAITDASRYSATQRPLLSLSITDTGSSACTIDAGTAAMVFTISSGHDQWWTSTDCQTNPVHTVIKLEPHQTLTSVPIAWDRTRSSKTTCNSKTRPQAPAGGASYHLAVAVDGIASKSTKQFLLQ